MVITYFTEWRAQGGLQLSLIPDIYDFYVGYSFTILVWFSRHFVFAQLI